MTSQGQSNEGIKRNETLAIIRNWMICKGEPERIAAPESRRPVLRGLVYGHEVHEDGSWVTTSSVKGRVGDRLLVASGRLYELEAPDPAYESRFPDARDRVLKASSCVALLGSPELHAESQAA